MTASEDQAIRDAITERLGDSWKIGDLKGRLKRLSYIDHPGEILTLDDKPIMEIFPVECKVENRGDKILFVASRPYRTFAQNASSTPEPTAAENPNKEKR